MKSFGLTDKGLVREFNEDHFYRCDKPIGNLHNLYVVADGMGGHNAGDIASKLAVAYMIKYIEESDEKDLRVLLIDAVLFANEQVYQEGISKIELNGMGTTLVACTINDNIAHVINIGDSRLYVMTDEFKQITADHSVVEELFRAGHITKAESIAHPDRNIITRAIGAEGTAQVDYFEVNLKDVNLIVMCTDGLNKMVQDEAIANILKADESLESIAHRMVDGAIELGGSDNITVVLVRTGNEVCS